MIRRSFTALLLAFTFGLGTLLTPAAAFGQEVVNGDKAKAFFSQFEKRSPSDFSITFDSLPREPSLNPSPAPWTLSPKGTINIGIDGGYNGGPTPTIKVDESGKRYAEQVGNSLSYANQTGFGYWLYGDRDAQFSDSFPAALNANRVSYLVRVPDKLYLPDKSVVDVKTDPKRYLRVLHWHKGNYNQLDGPGWIDSNPESNNWHFYWMPSEYWPQEGPYNIKIESLGDNFQRITFGEQPTANRTGWKYGTGMFGPTTPELATYEGDRFTILRSETRHYWTSLGGQVSFYPDDPGGATPSVFDDGLPIWQNYGVSFWREEDEVEVVALTAEKPSGTSFVQIVSPTSGPRYIDYPIEIRNFRTTSASYRVLVSGLQANIPVFDPLAARYLLVYADTNQNGVLDSAELSSRLGKLTPSIPAGGKLKYIARVDTSELPGAVTEFSLTVNLNDPADPMSLKGASLLFASYRDADISGAFKQNVWFTNAEDVRRPPNRAPNAVIRATVNGSVISNGGTVTAGAEVLFESTGVDPDGTSNSRTQMSHRFYTPEGHSFVGNTFRYRPWRSGTNTFLLHVSDGYSRAFQDFTVNVVEAANAAPVANIEYPAAGASYPANFKVFFGAPAGEQFNRDPDGGPASSKRGITRFDWSFGDGTSASNDQFPEHSYAQAGTYTIALTVTDDEGGTSSMQRSLIITNANRAPAARIDAVDSASFMEFGLVEVTAAGSTDPDGASDIAAYRWKFTGPNGYTNADNQVFVQNPPRYLFQASGSGTYTIYLTVEDKWGAVSTATTTVNVRPWDGIIRGNIVGNVASVGPSFGDYDIDPQIKKGWPILYGGQNIVLPKVPVAKYGAATVYGFSGTALLRASNNTLPAGTPPELAGIFSSAGHTIWGPEMFTLENLPAGRYDVTAYIYDSTKVTPGTKYLVNFGALKLEITVPVSPTYQSFIARGTVSHPGGNLAITGAGPNGTEPTSPLAGFILTPAGGDQVAPGAPGGLRSVN